MVLCAPRQTDLVTTYTKILPGETAMNAKCPNEGRRSQTGIRGSGFGVPHSAFTLIELLVTITIISILAGISLGALHFARQSTIEGKTKATIAKLNALVMQRYESYLTRRVPIDTTGMKPKDAAIARLNALRDLMRMEMPERWSDVTNPPITSVLEPALKKAYFQRYAKSSAPNNEIQKHGDAKCLYMIVSMGNPEAMEQFGQDEIAIVDGDDFPVFIDAWGTPIGFLRWAPGFNNSDVQGNIDTLWNVGQALTQRQIATTNDHDPFDPQRVDLSKPDETNSTNNVPTGWRLVPLIYSYGPDKEEGIYSAKTYTYIGNPYETILGNSGNGVGLGTPDGTGKHFDNIHNHRIEQQ
jgi:prepilin-type N-terminal cleavage/methylation domain-containing protein